MSGMRLRLRILRNELPPVTTLWPISDTQQKNTITQLLEQVNNVFPLESESWGLEHYVVTVASFEALHYHEIGAVCRDEDEVVIRPLSYAEVRARTLLGRDQIAPDGRHLYDGLPYGRPLLRGVVRPEVKIPARKRRRLEIEEAPHANDEVDANEGAVVKFGDLDEEDEESEDDGDFEIEEEEEEDSEESLDEAESEASSEASGESGRESEESSDSDTSSSSDDTSDDDDSSGSESWDGIQSGPHSPGKEAASKTALGSRMAFPESQQVSQSASGTQQHPSSSKASSEKDTSAQISSSKEPAKFVGIPQQGKTKTQDRNARRRDSKKLAFLKREGTLPSDATLANLREWEATNEVGKSEIAQDQLQPESTSANQVDGTSAAVENEPPTETLANSLEAENHKEEGDKGEDEAEEGAEEGAEEEVEDEDEGPETQSNLAAKQLEIKRQTLLAQIDSGGVEVESKAKRGRKRRAADIEDNGNTGDSTTSSIAPTVLSDEETPENIDTQDNMAGAAKKKALGATDMIPSSVARRSRLDVAGSKRLLLGSLGVRVPKTQEEKDALQKKLKERNDQRIAPPPDPEAPAPAPKEASKIAPTDDQQNESEDDGESWREKIDLNAIECCEEGITLSTPPFPFHQRWDPQQRRKKSKGRNGIAYSAGQRAHPATGKGRKKRSGDYMAGEELIETYDKYNQNGGGDALDYDDEWGGDEDDEYWEEGALLDGDYDDEDEYSADQQLRGEAAMGELDDGFPSLPEDVTTLPLLAEKDAKKSDFVVYTELVCSAATGWQPRMLTRTVQLMGKEDDGWDVKMPTRDLRPKEYDGEGNRVYDKFEMQGLSDDEGEEDTKTMAWAEMIEPRLLHRSLEFEQSA
ncbi:hypothetical protein D0869_14508 [Hortaea werneckii]|uniref:DUF7357 domain-containing protein n=1 Tax=Hortaea werneckii TaxID=91943 RepID=A0A3M6W1X4_HORWE|nr:hypothetical protein KC324_g12051 [Hortaea werneckii]KAI7576873.1 hypothetical protein KC316_g10509 [Hortaea werneckii]RMX72544.1 hypothetical protein D0869_14508 [Hortaea werneckii]